MPTRNPTCARLPSVSTTTAHSDLRQPAAAVRKQTGVRGLPRPPLKGHRALPAFGADCGPVHIGIDSGSTTIKLVVIDNDANILFERYRPNLGNPIPLVRETLLSLYKDHPGLQIASVTTTGYGEELVKNAFHCDRGLVETVAHFTAAKHFLPDVDFIIDIGGQDMSAQLRTVRSATSS